MEFMTHSCQYSDFMPASTHHVSTKLVHANSQTWQRTKKMRSRNDIGFGFFFFNQKTVHICICDYIRNSILHSNGQKLVNAKPFRRIDAAHRFQMAFAFFRFLRFIACVCVCVPRLAVRLCVNQIKFNLKRDSFIY